LSKRGLFLLKSQVQVRRKRRNHLLKVINLRSLPNLLNNSSSKLGRGRMLRAIQKDPVVLDLAEFAKLRVLVTHFER